MFDIVHGVCDTYMCRIYEEYMWEKNFSALQCFLTRLHCTDHSQNISLHWIVHEISMLTKFHDIGGNTKREITFPHADFQRKGWFSRWWLWGLVDDASSICAREGNGEPTNCVTGQLLQVDLHRQGFLRQDNLDTPMKTGFLRQDNIDFFANTNWIFLFYLPGFLCIALQL